MKLSLTLPSLFPGPAARITENVRATVGDVDYEILLVSPFEMGGPNVRWIREDTPAGCGAAHATACRNATGDVIFPLADDIELRPGWASAGFRELQLYERNRPYALGVGQVNQIVGTVFGIYYPFFPMARQSTLDAVGGFYRPGLKHHFTDADFAFRIWSIGGACGFTEGDYVERTPRNTDGMAATPNASPSRETPPCRRTPQSS